MKPLFIIPLLLASALLLTACPRQNEQGAETATTASTTDLPQFNADSALALVARQCEMGPRVPGSEAHRQCSRWLAATLARWCDTVMVQQAPVTTALDCSFTMSNIIGIIHPQAERRMLLLAHWDCRPVADADPDPARRGEPVMGANDAASGTGVLLELARTLQGTLPESLGVDILLVDAEDSGENNNEDSWGLGTQYWAAHPHVAGYSPLFGILLDMVGDSQARFAREYYSTEQAGSFVDLVWQHAAGSHFVSDAGGAVTDDHTFVNRVGIPCIDIIDQRTDSGTGFFAQWHTTDDTMTHISAATLGEVGQTLVAVLFDLANQ